MTAPPIVSTAGLALPVRHRRHAFAACAAAFVLSGASGLIYQVAWQRILALHSGVGIYSVAAIVGAFMLGLGLGSHAGGALSLRLGPRACVRAFALVELAVGVFGASSGWFLYDVLYLRAAHLYSGPWRAALLHIAVLTPPTFLMGLSLPLLVRALAAGAGHARRTVGILYGLNLLGAGLGALLAPWVLIRFTGITGALRAAAAANVAAGLLGLLASARSVIAAEASGARSPAERARPLGLWVALHALGGFCALSLEVVWFRLLDVGVKSTAFTFGTLLALYLFGTAAGCLWMAMRRRPVADPLRMFLLCQCLLIGYAGVAVLALVSLPPATPVFRWFVEYWAHGMRDVGAGGPGPRVLRLYLLLPLALFGPSTVLMGVAFPVLQQGVQVDERTSGKRAGLLQAANIAGCLAGSLVVGLLGLRWIGSAGVLRVLMVCGVVFAVIGARVVRRPRPFLALGAGLALTAVALPGQWRLWTRLHGTIDRATLVREDETSVAALIPQEGGRSVTVNGKGHSWLPFGGMHTRLGAAPALVHPAPEHVAVIGLGSGDTAWAAACRAETRSVTVFEIAAGQPWLLARVAGEFPALDALLRDPRLHVVIADGRKALQDGPGGYDVIEADALWPGVADSGYLYSLEFFQLCARKLRPGGLVCTWAPTDRVYKTFTSALPYVIGLGDHEILIGGNDPIEVDPGLWRARLESAEVKRYLRDRVADSDWVLARLRALHRTGRRHPTRELNHDLFPRDEFASP
jgi:hypothetical protein